MLVFFLCLRFLVLQGFFKCSCKVKQVQYHWHGYDTLMFICIFMYNFCLIYHKSTPCQQYSHLLWPLPFPNTDILHVLMWHLVGCLSTISCCHTPKLLRLWQGHWQSLIYLSGASVHPQPREMKIPPYAWRNKTAGQHADARTALLLPIAVWRGEQWDVGIELRAR